MSKKYLPPCALSGCDLDSYFNANLQQKRAAEREKTLVENNCHWKCVAWKCESKIYGKMFYFYVEEEEEEEKAAQLIILIVL